jgi:hypothetical protein
MEYTFFGMQLVIKTFPNDGLRARLHQCIAESPAEQSLADKRTFYKRYSSIVSEALPFFELGFWDYIPRPADAEREYDKWCSEIEGSMATEKDEMGQQHDEMLRLHSRKEYIVTTLLFLLVRGGNSDLMCAERCDIEEHNFHTRMTYGHLLQTVPMLSFASVRADAVYLVPGNDQDGFSMDDLHGGGWEYLQPIT